MKTFYCFIGILLFSILPFCNSFAQWSTDPYNNLIVGYGLLPEIASDSAGGCYITYEQNLGYPRRLILERLNRYGYKPWGIGKRILGEFPEQSSAKIVEDGQHGVIISYQDYYSGGMSGPWISRLRVQRVDSSGNFLWGPTGVRVSLSETNQGNQAIVADGQGGCIVTWVDTLYTLRIQRIDNTGNRVFSDSGIAIATGIYGHPYVPLLSKPSPDIVIVGYSSTIFSLQSRLIKIDINGNIVWPSEVTLDFLLMNMVSDLYGGVICSGRRSSSGVTRIVCQRIDSSGIKLWNEPFVVLADSASLNNAGIPISTTDDGGGVFCWIKQQGDSLQLFAQRLSQDGMKIWYQLGVNVSQTVSQKQIPKSIGSFEKSSIFIWTDSRSPRGFYTQKLDSISTRLWDSTDVPLTIRNGNQIWLRIITDGSDGFVSVWYEEPSFAILAQQVSKYGNLGEVITNVKENFRDKIMQEFALYQNYPNPFNSSTIIKYETPKGDWVKLEVFDILGKKLKTLVDQYQHPGVYHVTFDANDIASGVYVYKLQTTQLIQIKKLTIIK